MIRSFTWVFGILFLAGVAGCTEQRSSNLLGDQLPTPSLDSAMTLYPSEAELDPFAKADALEVTGSFPDIYGFTEPPPGGSRLIPEWAPGSSVLVAWHEDFAPYFTELIAALSHSTLTWVICRDVFQSEAVEMHLAAEGVDISNVLFFEYEHEAFWTRDYGPWSVIDPDGAVHFVDPVYYATRYRDNAVPTLLASFFGVDAYRPRLDAEGGNIMTNGAGLCVSTTRLAYNNPPQFSFELDDLTAQWLGCERTVFLEPLDDERTGHVDLLAKFLSPDLVMVSQYDDFTDSENARICHEAAARLADLKLADGRSVTVVRIPTPEGMNKVFRTYTNALQTDDAIFVPMYDGYDALNEQALEIYRANLPMEVSVVPVNASSVVQYGGAVHCTTMQMHHDAFVEAPHPDDAPQAWSVPQDALGEVAESPIEPGDVVTRTLQGWVPATVSLCPGDCADACGHGASAACTNHEAWTDTDGDGCSFYEQQPAWCDDATDYTNIDGVDASIACCICGGGVQDDADAVCGDGECDAAEAADCSACPEDCLDKCNISDCDADEFACGDGACVVASWACDGQEDCADGSDEASCTLPDGCGDGVCEEQEAVCHLDMLEVYLDIDGRNPNQVLITLSNGDIMTVLHDPKDVSILDPMPKSFVTDAFMGVEDTGQWILTVEVEPNLTRAGLHRWYIRAAP